jgi:hypothetical protein
MAELTEERIRQIVREELRRILGEQASGKLPATKPEPTENKAIEPLPVDNKGEWRGPADHYLAQIFPNRGVGC